MQHVVDRPYKRWTAEEKEELRQNGKECISGIADRLNLPFETVYAMWRHQHEEHISEIPTFDYSKIIPLKALFTRCPVCSGTTSVNKVAYCRSCLSQWHPISLKPIEGLHDPELW